MSERATARPCASTQAWSGQQLSTNQNDNFECEPCDRRLSARETENDQSKRPTPAIAPPKSNAFAHCSSLCSLHDSRLSSFSMWSRGVYTIESHNAIRLHKPLLIAPHAMESNQRRWPTVAAARRMRSLHARMCVRVYERVLPPQLSSHLMPLAFVCGWQQ